MSVPLAFSPVILVTPDTGDFTADLAYRSRMIRFCFSRGWSVYSGAQMMGEVADQASGEELRAMAAAEKVWFTFTRMMIVGQDYPLDEQTEEKIKGYGRLFVTSQIPRFAWVRIGTNEEPSERPLVKSGRHE